MKRLLITGAGGFVGSRVECAYRDKYAVITIPPGRMRDADEDDVSRIVFDGRPDVIVHAAALSSTVYCEKNPDDSYRANVLIPTWIAKAAKKTGTKLVCFSSDQVYSGLRGGPFDESTRVVPNNVYGRHKLMEETEVLKILPEAVLLRATWMYDFPCYLKNDRPNMLINLLTALAKNEPVTLSANDYRGFTYVRHAVELLEPVFDIPGGVYNFGSENNVSAYDTALDFLRAMGLENRSDLIIKNDKMPPRSLLISNENLVKNGVVFDDTRQGIRRCLKDYNIPHCD